MKWTVEYNTHDKIGWVRLYEREDGEMEFHTPHEARAIKKQMEKDHPGEQYRVKQVKEGD